MNRIITRVLWCVAILIYIPVALASPIDKAESLETTLFTTEQTQAFYTVQLFASHQRQTAIKFANALTPLQNVVVIAVTQNHNTLYKVIDGQFSSYRQAQHYLSHHRNTLHPFRPWIAHINTDFQVILVQSCQCHTLQYDTDTRTKPHFYVAGGINMAKTITAGATGTAAYSQDAAGRFPVSETRSNKRGANGIDLQLGTGFIFPFARHWSTRLGGRLSYLSLTQKGAMHSTLYDSDYQYAIAATTLTMVGRLSYHLSRWRYYGELTFGWANLLAHNLTEPGHAIVVQGERHNHLTYGAGIGLSYALSRVTGIELGLNYIDLGTATLGARQQVYNSQGQLKQRLHLVSGAIRLIHWF